MNASLIPAVATAVVTGIYIMGFIITQVYIGQYELPEYELLRARYLAAGTTFLVFSIGPLLAVMLSLSEISRQKSLEKEEKRSYDVTVKDFIRSKKAISAWGVFIFILFVAIVNPAYITPPPGKYLYMALYFALAYGLIMAFLRPFYMVQWMGTQSQPAIKAPTGIITSSVLMVWWLLGGFFGLGASFGYLAYPRISPAWGGGAVWVGTIRFRNESEDSSMPVVLTSNNQEHVRFLVCEKEGGKSTLKPTTMKWMDISVVQLDSLAILWRVQDQSSEFCAPQEGQIVS